MAGPDIVRDRIGLLRADPAAFTWAFLRTVAVQAAVFTAITIALSHLNKYVIAAVRVTIVQIDRVRRRIRHRAETERHSNDQDPGAGGGAEQVVRMAFEFDINKAMWCISGCANCS